MRKSFIPLAGIFLACIFCAAAIPAVAAAENPNPALNPADTAKTAETPQPWYAPITNIFGNHDAANTAGQSDTQNSWWENLLPWHENKVTATPQETSTQNPAQNPTQDKVQDKTPVPTPTPSPANSQAAKDPAPATQQNADKPQNPPALKTP